MYICYVHIWPIGIYKAHNSLLQTVQVNNSIEITTSVINVIETAEVLESQDISLIANLLDSVSNRTEDLQQEEVSGQVMPCHCVNVTHLKLIKPFFTRASKKI